MAPRSPQLHHALRAFTLGAFAYLLRELDDAGESLPFAFEEHDRRDGPTLYEYRPLVGSFVEERADRLRGREDALIALEELGREPAAAIYARAHAGRDPSADDALFRTILLDLLIRVAESCGGFDWDDECFDRAFGDLERSLFGDRRAYTAVAPLVGLTTGLQRVLSEGDARAGRSPTASSRGTGRRPRACCLRASAASPTATAWSSTASGLDAGEDVPDAPAEIADVVSAPPARDRGAAGCWSRALRDARRKAVRDPAGAADRRDPAAGRADEARRVPRARSRRSF